MEHIVVDAVIDKVLETYVVGLPCFFAPAHHHFDGIWFGAFRFFTVTLPRRRKICLASELVRNLRVELGGIRIPRFKQVS